MKKHRIRLNLLDLVIVLCLLCTVALLVFRDEVNELLGEPNIDSVELHISSAGVPDSEARTFKSGDRVGVSLSEDGDPVQCEITAVRFTPNNDGTVDLELAVIISGYRRVGVYYTESGEKIVYGSPVYIALEEGTLTLYADRAEYIDKTVTQ